jgi:hypothetical protein
VTSSDGRGLSQVLARRSAHQNDPPLRAFERQFGVPPASTPEGVEPTGITL